jgi:hypothetical protein
VSLAGLFQFLLFSVALALLGPEAATTPADAPSDLASRVRQVTEQFRDDHAARDACYAPFLGCVSGPQEGATGIHFVKMPLVHDGAIDVNTPEALLYEPKDGQLRLVGVEYLVIAADWRARHPNEIGAPVLNGQTFHFVDSPNRFGLDPFYELHVWAWQENPHGTFADWNTLVSCDGAR